MNLALPKLKRPSSVCNNGNSITFNFFPNSLRLSTLSSEERRERHERSDEEREEANASREDWRSEREDGGQRESFSACEQAKVRIAQNGGEHSTALRARM